MTLTLGNGSHFEGLKSHFCTFLPVYFGYCNELCRDIARFKTELVREFDLKQHGPWEMAAILSL